MKTIKKYYEKLFENANTEKGYRFQGKTIYLNQLSHFVGMKGSKYDNQKTRLLIVGRAVNGWKALDTSSKEKFAINAIQEMNDNHFNWIVCDNGILRNNEKYNGTYYWLNKSSFWRVAREIWARLTFNTDFQDSESDKWTDYIAWTNLYKIAPSEFGNPTALMSKKQIDACKDILKAEIEKFAPTHILFITGFKWWFEDYKDIFEIDFLDIKKNEYRGNSKNNNFVETYATTKDGIKIVVACRPEGRDEASYIEDVIKSFI